MVIFVAVSVQHLIQTTLNVVNGFESDGLPLGEDSPSWKRYFKPGDMVTFQFVFGRLQAVLGAPSISYTTTRHCMSYLSLQLIFGDGPDNGTTKEPNTNCRDGKAVAYTGWHLDASGTVRYYLVFCPMFFTLF